MSLKAEKLFETEEFNLPFCIIFRSVQALYILQMLLHVFVLDTFQKA
jgi:hypothetical protein